MKNSPTTFDASPRQRDLRIFSEKEVGGRGIRVFLYLRSLPPEVKKNELYGLLVKPSSLPSYFSNIDVTFLGEKMANDGQRFTSVKVFCPNAKFRIKPSQAVDFYSKLLTEYFRFLAQSLDAIRVWYLFIGYDFVRRIYPPEQKDESIPPKITDSVDVREYMHHLGKCNLYEQYKNEVFSGIPHKGVEKESIQPSVEAQIMGAISENNLAKLHTLLNEAPEINSKFPELRGVSALVYASNLGRTDAVKALLEAGAKVNLFDDGGQTALMHAASMKHGEIVDILIKAGAEVNTKDYEGQTALTLAVSRQADLQLVKELINAGSDVNSRSKYGQTALMFAATMNAPQAVQLLVQAGADTNTTDEDGQTALARASANGNDEVVRLLTDAKADVNLQDNLGDTPLMAAAYQGHANIVSMLLRAGADVHKKNRDGLTALQYSVNSRQEAKRVELQEMMRNCGALPEREVKFVKIDYGSLNELGKEPEVLLEKLEKGGIDDKAQQQMINAIKQFSEKNPTHMFFQGSKNLKEMLIRHIALNASMLGNYERAIEYSNEGLKINPKSAYLFYMKGRSEGDTGKYQEGLSDLDEAIKLKPDFSDAYVERGVIKRKIGRTVEANQDFRMAKKAEPSIRIPADQRFVNRSEVQ